MQRDYMNGAGNSKQRVANQYNGVKNAPSKEDIMRKIVKIQAIFRGILTRRYVKQVYNFQAHSSANLNNLVAYYQQPNYDN